MLVTEVSEDLGYTAIEAADGAAGLKILRSNVRIDLLVTDVGLPNGMNGRQVADAARVARPNLKVLFITGYAENAVLNHGHLAPGMHVIQSRCDERLGQSDHGLNRLMKFLSRDQLTVKIMAPCREVHVTCEPSASYRSSCQTRS